MLFVLHVAKQRAVLGKLLTFFCSALQRSLATAGLPNHIYCLGVVTFMRRVFLEAVQIEYNRKVIRPRTA